MLPLIAFSAASVITWAGYSSGPHLLYDATLFVRLYSAIFAVFHSFIVADTYSQG
ncbi:hypothetical protein JB92DRAFT_2997959 [Gautieria morchelliformis]|nr:hypothetical protein JB92DRAFT_2997959 [Gautieria morchelliformis]